MPLIKQIDAQNNTRLAVWQITEPAAYFLERLKLNKHDHAVLDTITAPGRLLEFLASRYVLRLLIGAEHSLVLQKDEYGKPYIHNPDCYISISHCKGLAAGMVSNNVPVALDLELPEERIKRIYPRFLSDREKGFVAPDDVLKTSLIWSAKETLYKIYGQKKLQFSRDIWLEEPDNLTRGTMQGGVQTTHYNRGFDVYFEVEDYILTWCVDC